MVSPVGGSYQRTPESRAGSSGVLARGRGRGQFRDSGCRPLLAGDGHETGPREAGMASVFILFLEILFLFLFFFLPPSGRHLAPRLAALTLV